MAVGRPPESSGNQARSQSLGIGSHFALGRRRMTRDFRPALSALAITASLAACGSDSGDGPLEDVNAIVFIERQPRMDGMGDIFQYQSYVPGARLMKLSPPTADGTLTPICCDQDAAFAEVDIIDFDINYGADQIVFSARIGGDERYQLYLLRLETGEITPIPTDPNFDYVYPAFLPQDRIVFATNAVVEEGAPQHRDEYERGTTLQMGAVNADGSQLEYFARNLSHKGIAPTVLSDGRIAATKWDHVAEQNAGHIVAMNPDGQRLVEIYGKEGTGVTNSYYKVTEAAPGHLITIASSRDRTFQSGVILQVFAGEKYEEGGVVKADREMSEANASYKILTQAVPLGEDPSSPTVGRYYNAYPLNAKEFPDLLVSWADGPVQSDVNGAAGVPPDFGIFLYESERQRRSPIYNNPGTWEINPLPLIVRTPPPVIPPAAPNQFDGQAVVIGSMNVYESSVASFDPDSIYGVRVIEGFSSEEGIPNDFGLTEHEGAAVLGVVPVQDDGSWAALIPAHVPVRQQAIDIFGMSLQSEPVWISGNAGESRFCGGCHEDRAATTVIEPGITDAIAVGPVDLLSSVDRSSRVTASFTDAGGLINVARDDVRDVPWDVAVQAAFDAKCISCHEGTPGEANPSYTITDPATGQSQTITFDLRGVAASYGFGEDMLTGYSASHLSIMGPMMMEIDENDLVISGDFQIYCEPGNARESLLIQKTNMVQMYPAIDEQVLAFEGPRHPEELGQPAFTAMENYLVMLACDLGGQFYSRFNAPEAITF